VLRFGCLTVSQIIIRFLVGGVAVSLFAALGDSLRPKSFAGLFGAAPSIALATLTLALVQKPASYAAIECRSMLFGACGLLFYCVAVGRMLNQGKMRALQSSVLALPIWFGMTFALWITFAR
jgi:Protein of unknown function (DUF3147)